MGLEGAVRLGYRRRAGGRSTTRPRARRAFDELVAAAYERGKAINVATLFEIDDVIDPADTRKILTSALTAAERTG